MWLFTCLPLVFVLLIGQEDLSNDILSCLHFSLKKWTLSSGFDFRWPQSPTGNLSPQYIYLSQAHTTRTSFSHLYCQGQPLFPKSFQSYGDDSFWWGGNRSRQLVLLPTGTSVYQKKLYTWQLSLTSCHILKVLEGVSVTDSSSAVGPAGADWCRSCGGDETTVIHWFCQILFLKSFKVSPGNFTFSLYLSWPLSLTGCHTSDSCQSRLELQLWLTSETSVACRRSQRHLWSSATPQHWLSTNTNILNLLQ